MENISVMVHTIEAYSLGVKNCIPLPLLETDNFSPHLPHFIINMQHSNTASFLPASVGGATWIKQEQAVAVLVAGDVAVAVDDDTGKGIMMIIDTCQDSQHVIPLH